MTTVSFHTPPDKEGKRQFTVEWTADNGRPRAQVFYAVPDEHLARWRARGEVVVQERPEPR